MSIVDTLHVRELLQGSAVYDDVSSMMEVQLVETPEVTYVSYLYEGTIFIDIWFCDNGYVPVSECEEPDVRYTNSDPEFHIIQPLIDMVEVPNE